MALSQSDTHKLDFNQDLDLDNFEWEPVLLEFVGQFKITFIKLELLMLFYRNRLGRISSEAISKRTGYHVLEIDTNINKLVSDRLLGCERKTGSETLYYKLGEPDFAGRELMGKVIRRLAQAFDDRTGRLQIIFAILKSQEAD